VGEIVPSTLLLAGANHHGAERVARHEALRAERNRDGGVTATGGLEAAGEAEENLRVGGLPGGLCFEERDFRGRDVTRPRPACTGHDQSAHSDE
jgi:hypothetical protein